MPRLSGVMKGTDCTPAQLAHAQTFVIECGWKAATPEAIVSLDDIVRLIAWYGAIRFIAARDGVGDLEHPAPLVCWAPDLVEGTHSEDASLAGEDAPDSTIADPVEDQDGPF